MANRNAVLIAVGLTALAIALTVAAGAQLGINVPFDALAELAWAAALTAWAVAIG